MNKTDSIQPITKRIHVLLYSFGQGCFHIETLNETIRIGAQAFAEKRTTQDYIVIAASYSKDDISKIADNLRAEFGQYEPTRKPCCCRPNEIITNDHALFFDMANRIGELIKKGCDHSHRATTIALAEMGANIDGTLEWLDAHGGHCDCEVMMNIAVPEQDRRDHEKAMGNDSQ